MSKSVEEQPSLLRPFFLPLVLGMAIGFGACCFAGWRISQHSIYQNFLRFHQFLQPATLYFPTVLEMCAIVRDGATKDDIIVIIGGSSVANGVMQKPDELWSKRLQAELGPKYKVFNFAMYGCAAAGGGSVVAEVLAKEFPKVIFITDEFPLSIVRPDGTPPYVYLYWDAKTRGMLYDFPARDTALEAGLNPLPHAATVLDLPAFLAESKEHFLNPPDAATRTAHLSQEKERDHIAELRRAMELEKFFYFQELWNAVSYDIKFTVYNRVPGVTDRGAFKNRRGFRDEVNLEIKPVPQRYTDFPGSAAVIAGNMAFARNFINLTSKVEADGKLSADLPYWQGYRYYVATAFPPEMRPHMLVMVTAFGRWYYDQLTPEEKKRADFTYATARQCWEEIGVQTVAVGQEFEPVDYVDMLHHTPSGGVKMALIAAPAIRKIAEARGYVTAANY